MERLEAILIGVLIGLPMGLVLGWMLKEYTVNYSITSEGVYFLAVLGDTTVSDSLTPISLGYIEGWAKTQTYGALPDPFPAGATVVTQYTFGIPILDS